MSAAKDIPGQLDLFGGEVVRPAPRASAGPQPHPCEPDVHRLAQALQGIHLGTSSWSFPGWSGLVYRGPVSESALARQGLRAYAQHPLLTSVGLDRTYYASMSAEALAELADSVPAHFRFLVKAHEAVTWSRFPNQSRYASLAGQDNPQFLDPDYAADMVVGPAVEGLGSRLGVILFQFPPQSRPSGYEFAVQVHEFLERLPKGPRYAFELRNRSWLTPAWSGVLRRQEALHCLNVHPTMPDLSVQEPLAAEGPCLVIRWMLGRGQEYQNALERYKPFDRLVDPDPATRSAVARLCRQARDRGQTVFVIINNKAEGSAPLSVLELAREIADGV